MRSATKSPEGPMEPWMRAKIDGLVTEHGAVPPPWVIFDEHPYSICWRMGGGETHIMVWWAWWPRQGFTEDQRIAYFRQWPPPHCWLAFLIEAVWGVADYDEAADLTPYFARTAALGFGSEQDYQLDLNDPKWLERQLPSTHNDGEGLAAAPPAWKCL